MPITVVDPRAALIVIDLQRGHMEIPLAHPVEDIIERTTALAKAFRNRELPVVLVTVAGAPTGRTDTGTGTRHSFPTRWADLIPELNRQPADIVLVKYARSAFTGTGLAGRLRDLGVTQVVITGVSTGGGVESTARDAHEQGFNVTLPIDAMTDTSLPRHEHVVTQVFPRIAETGSTTDVLNALASRFRGGLLGEFEVTEVADEHGEHGEHSAPLVAEDLLERGQDAGPGVGRISTAPPKRSAGKGDTGGQP